MLNESDRKILDLLQTDARISNQDLAEQAAMSASACWRRVRALEEEGIISGYAALVDPARAGLGFSAILHVSLTRHESQHVEQFIAAVMRRPEIVECFATTGETDYHLRVICTDKEAYNAFLDNFLFKLPGLAHVRTNLVLKDIKLTVKMPV
ncbi:MAG: Lrp/AsnC family transcriptional regulator [Proteobacteria bacterium]|nr:Lrp/AsnC family transcriptional regulator [Pseudomonadota bacterium]